LSFAEESRDLYLGDLDGLHKSSVVLTMEATIAALFIAKGLRSPQESDKNCIAVLTEAVIDESSSFGGEAISAEIGTALERLRGRRLVLGRDGRLFIGTSPEQRSQGVYFTPPQLANSITRAALSPVLESINSLDDLQNFAILDPAAGCGSFLLSAFRTTVEILEGKAGFALLGRQLRLEIAEHCIYGVDIDPVAIATVYALLIAEVGDPNWNADKLNQHLHIGDSIGASIDDWNAWFPERAGGFNVITTNPPWSKLRPLRHEFFEHINTSVRLLQGSGLGRYLKQSMSNLEQDSWSQYTQRTIDLSNRLRDSDEYIVNQKAYGDPDLYKYFLERSIALLAPNGVAGLLVPSGVLRAKGSGPLRCLLREKGHIAEIVEYINRKKLFDIHPMYRFATVLFKNGQVGNGTLVRFGEEEPVEPNSVKGVFLESDFFNYVGGLDHLIPEVRSDAEKLLLARLYKDNPITDGIGGDNLSFKRELDMTNDAKHFIDFSEASERGFQPHKDGRWLSESFNDVLLPVYEGRMVHQYNSSAKEYLSGQGRSAKWKVPIPGQGRVRPHFFVTEDYARSRGWEPKERVGYCEISGHANERTILASLIPPFSICGNKVPILKKFEGGDQFLWLALANSIVIDWVMRRWVSTTINQFYWKNVVFPNSLNEADCLFLKEAAQQLSAPNIGQDDSSIWLGKRSQLRAAIDAVVMNAFGITLRERETILNDFPIFSRANKQKSVEAISLDKLLEVYVQAHLNGILRIETIHTLCDPHCCSTTYATKDQAAWLNLCG
jgi:hypothetical protein